MLPGDYTELESIYIDIGDRVAPEFYGPDATWLRDIPTEIDTEVMQLTPQRPWGCEADLEAWLRRRLMLWELAGGEDQ